MALEMRSSVLLLLVPLFTGCEISPYELSGVNHEFQSFPSNIEYLGNSGKLNIYVFAEGCKQRATRAAFKASAEFLDPGCGRSDHVQTVGAGKCQTQLPVP